MRGAVLFCSLLVACGGGDDDGVTPGLDADLLPTDAAVDAAPPDAEPPPPERPAELTAWLVGNDADAPVTPAGPGLVLMGGGTDVDAAFTWWAPRVAGGDVVVLRTSGEDGYNDYLLGFGADSVETMRVDTRALADSDYVAWRVAHAEGVFLAGGDQATYVTAWKGTRLAGALGTVWARGGVVGGTSAGCAVLGEIVFAALQGSVYSDEALGDPYNPYMTMERQFVAFAPVAGVVTDTHFAARDRMGRLVAFMARAAQDGWATSPIGLGVDEGTALVVDGSGLGVVLGDGHVYLVVPGGAPSTCAPGQPLDWSGLTLHRLAAGDTVTLPAGTTAVPGAPLAADGGTLTPADPY